MNQSDWTIKHDPYQTERLDAVLIQSNYPNTKKTVFYCFPFGYKRQFYDMYDVCYWRIKSLKTKTEK